MAFKDNINFLLFPSRKKKSRVNEGFFFPSRSTCSHIQGNVLEVLTERVEFDVLIAAVSFIFTSNDLDHLASFFFKSSFTSLTFPT